MTTTRHQRGFTLIELMIVVAIVGILAALAFPAYRDFIVRAKVSELLANMSACKLQAADFYLNNNGWARRTDGANIAGLGFCDTARSQYTDNVAILANGAISGVTANTDAMGPANARNQVVQMTPDCDANAAGAQVCDGTQDIEGWVCGDGATALPAKYRPGSCQG